MALKIKEHHEHMTDFGDDVRIERHARSEDDGSFLWSVYSREETNGTHPVHGGETTEEHVWVKRFSGPEDMARAKVRELTGE